MKKILFLITLLFQMSLIVAAEVAGAGVAPMETGIETEFEMPKKMGEGYETGYFNMPFKSQEFIIPMLKLTAYEVNQLRNKRIDLQKELLLVEKKIVEEDKKLAEQRKKLLSLPAEEFGYYSFTPKALEIIKKINRDVINPETRKRDLELRKEIEIDLYDELRNEAKRYIRDHNLTYSEELVDLIFESWRPESRRLLAIDRQSVDLSELKQLFKEKEIINGEIAKIDNKLRLNEKL